MPGFDSSFRAQALVALLGLGASLAFAGLVVSVRELPIASATLTNPITSISYAEDRRLSLG